MRCERRPLTFRSAALARALLCAALLAGCSEVAHRPIPSSTAGAPVPGKFLVNVDANGVALQGYDPVAYFVDGRPVQGEPGHASAYRGAIQRARSSST